MHNARVLRNIVEEVNETSVNLQGHHNPSQERLGERDASSILDQPSRGRVGKRHPPKGPSYFVIYVS